MSLRQALRPLNAPFIDPPMLIAVDQVVRLVGESLRGRLLTVSGAEGEELCLRPDMTIPVALHYAQSPLAGQAAAYRYDGPVFRAALSGLPQDAQTAVLGVERFAEADRAAVDVELLTGALEVCAAGGATDVEIILADLSVFEVFLAALQVEEPWGSRLMAAARRPAALERMLSGEELALSDTDPARSLIGLTPSEIAPRALALAEAAQQGPLAGRSLETIAARLADKARLAQSPPPKRAVETLRALLALKGEPRQVREGREALAKKAGLDIGNYLQHAARRLDAILQALPMGARLVADPQAEGAFWYYDGFMFQVRAGDKAIAAGGRYDGLLKQMTAGRIDAPAAGFTVYPQTLGGGS